jgi:hypothetical protein
MYACTVVSNSDTSWVCTSNAYSILGLNEWVVDSDDMNVIMLDGITIHDTPDSSEAVDTDVGRHSDVFKLFSLGVYRLGMRLRGALSFS